MMKYRMHSFWLVALTLLLASCSSDEDNGGDNPGEVVETDIFGVYQGTVVVTPIGALDGQPTITLPKQLLHVETYPQPKTLQLVVKDFEYEDKEYGNITVASVYKFANQECTLEAKNTVRITNLGKFEVQLLGSIKEEVMEIDATFSSAPSDKEDAQPLYQVTFQGTKTDKTFTNIIFNFNDWGSASSIPGNETPYQLPIQQYDGFTWASTDAEVDRLIANERMDDYTVKSSKEAVEGQACAQIMTLAAKGDNKLHIPSIYGGQLYLGQFIDKQMPPYKGVQVGVPFAFNPSTLKGYYNYQSGEVYYHCPDPTQPREVEAMPEQQDTGVISAYLYEVSSYEATHEILHINQLETSPKVVAVAQYIAAPSKETQEFDVTFRWKEGKAYNPAQPYRLALRFASSKEGHRYSGAPGSVLRVDYVRIIVEE